MGDYVPLLVALIAGPVTVVITTRVSKPKVQAENAETMTNVAMKLVAPLKAQITDLELEIVGLKAALQASENEKHLLMQWAAVLVEHLVKAGERPVSFEEFKGENGHT